MMSRFSFYFLPQTIDSRLSTFIVADGKYTFTGGTKHKNIAGSVSNYLLDRFARIEIPTHVNTAENTARFRSTGFRDVVLFFEKQYKRRYKSNNNNICAR